MVEGGGADHQNVESDGKSSNILSSVDKAQEWRWAILCLSAYCIVAAQGTPGNQGHVVLSSTCIIPIPAQPL